MGEDKDLILEAIGYVDCVGVEMNALNDMIKLSNYYRWKCYSGHLYGSTVFARVSS